jgi:hypothetical protein
VKGKHQSVKRCWHTFRDYLGLSAGLLVSASFGSWINIWGGLFGFVILGVLWRMGTGRPFIWRVEWSCRALKRSCLDAIFNVLGIVTLYMFGVGAFSAVFGWFEGIDDRLELLSVIGWIAWTLSFGFYLVYWRVRLRRNTNSDE